MPDIRFQQYLNQLTKPYHKLVKLEFLQPDGSVAFFLDNKIKKGYNGSHTSSAFIQDGSLSVSLQNGTRRKATIVLANVDGTYSYNVNKIWFGRAVRLSMGLVLPDLTEFYLPMGVFYIQNPSASITPQSNTITYNLVDKWSYLDGTLFGNLEASYVVNKYSADPNPSANLFNITTNGFFQGAWDYMGIYGGGTQSRKNSSNNFLCNNTLISVLPNTTYYFSVVGDNVEIQGVTYHKMVGGISTCIGYNSGNKSKSFVITTPADCQTIGFNIHTANGKTISSANVQYMTVTQGVPVNIFTAIQDLLHLSVQTFTRTDNPVLQIDTTLPVFTTYYKYHKYKDSQGQEFDTTVVPYDITINTDNGTVADVVLALNEVVAGLIGYDAAGALRIEPSQESISDVNKPVIWDFAKHPETLCSYETTAKNSDVRNDVIVTGTGLNDEELFGRATNFDATSDTNVYRIGRRTFREQNGSYWTSQQCADLAEYYLKQQTVLQHTISIECTQLFHIQENRLIAVRRTDKDGSPIENHLIQSFTIPIGETGTMTINATSVNDFPVATKTTVLQ
mgnify:CR=1 FL=1